MSAENPLTSDVWRGIIRLPQQENGQMIDKPEVTAARLRELLDYDPMTGVFTWKVQRKGKGKMGAQAGRLMPKTGYRTITVDGAMYYANRLAWLFVHGEMPERIVILNDNRDDARIENLEARKVIASGAKTPSEYGKMRRAQDPVAHRKYVIKRYQGMTVEEYQAKFLAQNGVCAICTRPETAKKWGSTSWLSVDHCHKTGANRDLLCHACNMAIGAFDDDPARLRVAADYLDRHAERLANVIPLRSNA